MYADFMIWPWLERFEFLEKHRGVTFDKARLSNFLAYIERMKHVSACEKLSLSAEKHDQFYDSMLNKDQADYDIGIEQ